MMEGTLFGLLKSTLLCMVSEGRLDMRPPVDCVSPRQFSQKLKAEFGERGNKSCSILTIIGSIIGSRCDTMHMTRCMKDAFRL